MNADLFADTIIATFLRSALSALYCADRLNQLPIGVIGIAIGTVLLPEMSRRLTAGDFDGAAVSQRAPSISRCCSRCRSSRLSGGT
jgi:putative peptidoglycan lipid II flippase